MKHYGQDLIYNFHHMKQCLIMLCCGCAAALNAREFKFANVISENMVLQRDLAVPVWGFAEPGDDVVVELNGRCVGEAKTGADGRWLVRLPAQAANKNAAEICATRGTDKITIGNILFGDVWFGCGQSNMAYTFSGYGRLPVGGEEFLERAKGNRHSRARLMNDKGNKNSPYPREDAIDVKW